MTCSAALLILMPKQLPATVGPVGIAELLNGGTPNFARQSCAVLAAGVRVPATIDDDPDERC